MNRPEPLADWLAQTAPFAIPGRGAGADYAAHLLRSLGAQVTRRDAPADPHPALDWAQSGAMYLTGYPERPPQLAPGPLASCARGAVAALDALVPGGVALDGPALLGEHATASALHRRGQVSPGGRCRLLRTADAWIAVNLARADDVASLGAWLGPAPGSERMDDPWEFVAARVAERRADEVVDRGRLLGLPVSVAAAPPPRPPRWLRIAAAGPTRVRATNEPPLVVDLTSLWAGPLCGHLLTRSGARVLKLESPQRPDGARSGPQPFFDLLNGGKASLAIDFATDAGRQRLHRLLRRADIVLESARPRALRQLGLEAETIVVDAPGKVWVSITGYGRREPEANWVAFGDDAAAAAGLAVATGTPDAPIFCGDAIADPLAGLHAAVAALAAWRSGHGALLDVSLRDVSAHACAFPADSAAASVEPSDASTDAWRVFAGADSAVVAPPRIRPSPVAAPALGADTHPVLTELGISC